MRRPEDSPSWGFSRCRGTRHRLCDNVGVAGLWWDEEDADYIRHRSDRYPGALNIEPGWTLEAAADPRAIVRDPDSKSALVRSG